MATASTPPAHEGLQSALDGCREAWQAAYCGRVGVAAKRHRPGLQEVAMIISRRLRAGAPRTCAAATLVSAAMSLTACVGDNPPPRPGAAPAATHSAMTGTPTPAPVVTLAPIPRDKPVAIVAGTPVSGADYADRVTQQAKGAAAQAQQQQGVPTPDARQIRS